MWKRQNENLSKKKKKTTIRNCNSDSLSKAAAIIIDCHESVLKYYFEENLDFFNLFIRLRPHRMISYSTNYFLVTQGKLATGIKTIQIRVHYNERIRGHSKSVVRQWNSTVVR